MDTAEKKTTFEIPSFNLGLLNDKLEKLNRKAKKLGCAPITTKVLGFRRTEIQVVVGTHDNGVAILRPMSVTFYQVEVEGIAPKFSDWTFAGTLEHAEAGNIVRSVPGQELPASFREGKAKCDHCQTIRRRKDTYIVKHEVTGEFKQVGHQCVRDFLGHTDPARLAWLATIIKELEDLQGGESFGRRVEESLTSDFLEFAAECVIRFGWVSRSAAQAYAEKSEGAGHLDTTAGLAWKYMHPTKEMIRDGKTIEVSQRAKEIAAEALLWGKNLINNDRRNDYEHNIAIACGEQFVTHRRAGILASVISSYQRFLGKEEVRRNARKAMASSEFIGTVGKREIFEVTVVGEHTFESNFQYGPQSFTLFRMQDVNGNVCIWKTGTGALEVGKTYKLKATVKEHAVWKEIKQTVLQRCVEVQQ